MDHSHVTGDLTRVGCKPTEKDYRFEARLSFDLFQGRHYRWSKIIDTAVVRLVNTCLEGRPPTTYL